MPGLTRLFPILPRKVQILPIFAPGGILGFQGFVPCRAEKMASLFVDTSISQIGSISDFYSELDIDQLADGLAEAAQPDVKRLATEIVVLAGGRVAASGGAAEVLAARDLLPPEDRDEAGALIELVLVGEDAFGLSVLGSAAGEWRVPRVEGARGGRVRVRVRARDVMLALERPAGISALNVMAGVVVAVAEGQGPDALPDWGGLLEAGGQWDLQGEQLPGRGERASLCGAGLPGERLDVPGWQCYVD